MYHWSPRPRSLEQLARNSRPSGPRVLPSARGPIPRISTRGSPSVTSGSARASRHELAGLRDLRSDRIGILAERDNSRIVLLRPGSIAELLGSFRRTDRCAEPMRLLLQRRLALGDRLLGHAAIQQH